MKKLSILTGMMCLSGFTSNAKLKVEVPHSSHNITRNIEHCANDGNVVGKRYVVNYKGQTFTACCKDCATELLERLEHSTKV